MGRPIHIYRIHPFRYYDNNKWYEVPNRGEWRCTTKCRNMHLGGALVEGGGARFFKSSDLNSIEGGNLQSFPPSLLGGVEWR